MGQKEAAERTATELKDRADALCLGALWVQPPAGEVEHHTLRACSAGVPPQLYGSPQEAQYAAAVLPRRGRAKSPSFRPSLLVPHGGGEGGFAQSERLRTHLSGECDDMRAQYKRALAAF